MTQIAFDRRLARLVRKHDRMALGISYRLGRDGLITAHPRRLSPRFPVKALGAVVLTAFLLKAFLLASLGSDTYETRLAELASGGLAERAGALLMTADPVTLELAEVLRAFAP